MAHGFAGLNFCFKTMYHLPVCELPLKEEYKKFVKQGKKMLKNSFSNIAFL
jgi:hypothetical protein